MSTGMSTDKDRRMFSEAVGYADPDAVLDAHRDNGGPVTAVTERTGRTARRARMIRWGAACAAALACFVLVLLIPRGGERPPVPASAAEPDVSAATAAPGSEPLTEESETSKRMTSLQEAVGHNPYIGRVTVLSDPVPEVNGEGSVTAVVTESYQGLEEKDEITIRFYESDPTPWKKGFSAILFMQLYEDVIEETSYYWCGQRIYTAGGRLDTDSLRGVDGLTEEQFSEKLRETVGQYFYTGTDMICCPYIHSADPDTILRESPCILEVRVVSLEDVHATDREVAVCEPIRFLKGSPTARCRVTVPLNALRKGETYVLLLYKSPGNDEQYDLSSPHSIFPAGSEEAEYIRKQFP